MHHGPRREQPVTGRADCGPLRRAGSREFARHARDATLHGPRHGRHERHGRRPRHRRDQGAAVGGAVRVARRVRPQVGVRRPRNPQRRSRSQNPLARRPRPAHGPPQAAVLAVLPLPERAPRSRRNGTPNELSTPQHPHDRETQPKELTLRGSAAAIEGGGKVDRCDVGANSRGIQDYRVSKQQHAVISSRVRTRWMSSNASSPPTTKTNRYSACHLSESGLLKYPRSRAIARKPPTKHAATPCKTATSMTTNRTTNAAN